MKSAEVGDISIPETGSTSLYKSLPRKIVASPAGGVGLVLVCLFVAVAIAAPVISPYDPASQNIAARLQGPSMAHLLGTDQLGRDLLSRLIYASSTALVVSLPTTLTALLLGGLLGIAAGFYAGLVDKVAIIVMDTLQSFPGVALALTAIALLGPSILNLILLLTVSFVPYYARVTRALAMQIKQSDYVQAEIALGAGHMRIICMHMVPNMLPSLLTMIAMDIPSIITAEAGLSFLGLGVKPPAASWGSILNDGFGRISEWPWGVLCSGGAIVLATLSFTLLGERLRELLDPRYRHR